MALELAELARTGGAPFEAEYLDGAQALWNQSEDCPQEHRLAGARRADQAEDFPGGHVEFEMVDDRLAVKANDEILQADCEWRLEIEHCHIPIAEKNIANSPSITMTQKIDLTTDVVVWAPSDSALPFTFNPSVQATIPMTKAMKGDLIMPTSKSEIDTASRSRETKKLGSMPP